MRRILTNHDHRVGDGADTFAYEAADRAPFQQPAATAPRVLPESLDVEFTVPFVHRVRFTQDVFGQDDAVLADVLEASDGTPARVQFWLDGHVADAIPNLRQRIYVLSRKFRDRLNLAGNVQVVPGGEAVKNDVHILERMLNVIHAHDLDRRSYVVVIGGGAVLDAVGFATAIAHRGLRLVRIPTTTLAQADSGIGVKNAVNAFAKKNWIGTFAVPWAVINDANLLTTLPDREFMCGFAEAVKVSLLKDPKFFADLCRLAPRIQKRDMGVCLGFIRRSALLQLEHITRGGDPFETREARPLDFGHWSAHKLEVLTNFRLRHGEAVAIGVAIDTVYSSLVTGLPVADAQRVVRCLNDLGFVLDFPELCNEVALLAGMEEFRQHLGGRLTLTMLAAVGRPVAVHEIDLSSMRLAIQTVIDSPAAISKRSGGFSILRHIFKNIQ